MTGIASVGEPVAPTTDESVPVGGVVPLTTVDFPDRLALVVFTRGCPWLCRYCHNADLRSSSRPAAWRWRDVLDLLQRRRGLLDAVVFSGGEPTLHPGLHAAVRAVRASGFLIGLHTAGIFPERLGSLLPSLDWVGLDIKAPLDGRYARLTGDRESAEKVASSLRLLLASPVALQLRTTVGPGACSERDFDSIRQHLRDLGAPEPVRQEVRHRGAASPAPEVAPASASTASERRTGAPSLAEMPGPPEPDGLGNST